MAVVISAEQGRVWRALTDPNEIIRWDESRLAAVDLYDGYPIIGSKVRWRSKLGSVRVVLKEEPRLIEAPARIAASYSAGSLHYDQVYALDEEPEDRAQAARTRVSLKVAADNRVHLVGAEIDRFEVRKLLIERIDVTLRALQKWCETPSED